MKKPAPIHCHGLGAGDRCPRKPGCLEVPPARLASSEGLYELKLVELEELEGTEFLNQAARVLVTFTGQK